MGVRDSDADDVSQRVYLVFVARLERIRPGAERAYLYAIAAREAGHQRRSYRRRREQPDETVEELPSSNAPPDVLMQRKQVQCQVRAVLASMDAALRDVLVSFALEHRSLAEIAHASDLPLGTVKSRLRRARQWFAQALAEGEEACPQGQDGAT
jgi:RNA polymerase sigma-70 factor (ECF subfamily)